MRYKFEGGPHTTAGLHEVRHDDDDDLVKDVFNGLVTTGAATFEVNTETMPNVCSLSGLVFWDLYGEDVSSDGGEEADEPYNVCLGMES